MDHLSSLDASFLHMETPETPMHVGSLCMVELPQDYEGDFYDAVRKQVINRMHLARVFTRKLAPMPFELGDPVWIEDDDIDLDYHIRRVTVPPPGTMAQVESLAARLHSSLLDRSRPLWEIYVIEGTEDGRFGYYSKLHHAGIDGKSGTELAKVFFDTTPESKVYNVPTRRPRGQYQLGMAELLEASVNNAVQQYTKLAKLAPEAAKIFSGFVQNAPKLLGGDGKDLLASLKPAPKTIFNVAITNQRSFATVSLPLDGMKKAVKRHGATLNDGVMAICSSALRSFLEERASLPAESLSALVPVSLRADGDSAQNNQVAAIRVSLETDEKDPRKRWDKIRKSTETSKTFMNQVKGIIATDFPMMGSPWLMSSMASMYGRSNLVDRLPPIGNVLISNVPGPPIPLYVAGARMTHYFPASIPYHGQALNITLESYAGSLDFGFTACRRALPQDDLKALGKHLVKAFEELVALEPAGAAAAPNGKAEKAEANEKAIEAAAPRAETPVPAEAPAADAKPEKPRKKDAERRLAN
ncbi:putative diacylglycerol O-acyltransferase/MT3848 [Variibacter gotjawalensis]|uniref:diacylglycerol O-acyltransferase n=1 Tax=Variibacter gotjawalensis TaxID=1333996 RepID=A0A0S3PZJ1_9BRAD|nr:wax ester/triacylglycerol synthase family O-acyltransferase [Variibacter gotjawalensis]NIK47204.1 WS/DGAT/MGAT family acyltransferase [Variibacter gotjawalensis]RZS49104.1 diacylglycerol O-acyltransferase [Variibacter gotjawalensis]BAT61366.1 putative diacylglycerol O-acyltransferase/MT3848 [Variibacter gotjawalensis]